MLKKKGTLILTSLLVLVPVLAGLLLWNVLPEKIVTHWNATGQADGWSSKAFAVFCLPLILLATHWLCILVTASDKKNREQNRKALGMVPWICPIMSIFCGGVVYGTALGIEFDMNKLIFVLMGIIFFVIGNYLPKCKHNYTIGIKLPWTFASEENWNATHRFGGKVWVSGGILLIGCSLLPTQMSVSVMLLVLAVLVALPTLYSYLYDKKHGK